MKNGKVLGSILVCFGIIVLFTAQGFADPYQSYIFDYWGNPVPAPQAYTPVGIIEGSDLGVGDLREPRDIFVDHNNRIYLLDTGNRRLLVFDKLESRKRDQCSFVPMVFMLPVKHLRETGIKAEF